MEAIPGAVYRWTRNHADHPDDPSHNYFMVIDNQWGIKVRYLIDGKETTYTADTFRVHRDYLKRV